MPNPYLEPSAADAAAAPASDNPYIDTAPAPTVSTGSALRRGLADTATFGFSDELKALSEASGIPADTTAGKILGGFAALPGAARLGYEKFTGQPGEATEAYDRALAQARADQRAAEEQHPTAYTLGQVGGGVLTPGLGAAKGATMGARMLNTAKAGALTGALYGVGSGETPTERATGGTTGALLGGTIGAVASPVVDVAGFGVNKALLGGKKIYDWLRAEFNPAYVEGAAERRVGQAIAQDQAARPATLADLEATAAGHAAGIPRIAADEGGETTMGLARSAANQSPEAREALTEAARDRFAGQSQRGVQFIRNLTGGADATTTQEGLEAAARAANKPAYAKAYAEGAGGVWSPELERLAGSDAVSSAMQSAARKAKDEPIVSGYGAMNPRIAFTPDGRMQFNRGPNGVPTYPDLQYWDLVRRELSDAAQNAGRGTSEARRLGSFATALNTELDRLVPSYQAARQGAAAAFGAQDALEAGQKFVTARGENADFARAISRMSAPERQLFARGYASELADRTLELRDNQNVTIQQYFNSQAGRARSIMALGNDKAAQLEAWVRAESNADRLRVALGNSTTARQLAEMGLAGVGAGILGEGFIGGDLDKGHYITAALALGAAYGHHRMGGVDKSIATQIGKMLASDDPAVLQRGVAAVAKSQRLMGALRSAGDAINSVLSRSGLAAAATEQAMQPGRPPQSLQ
jgi:hypothetical protein